MSDNEGKLLQASARGAQAESLIRNELFEQTFSALRQQYTDNWIASEPHEQQKREYFWRAIQVLADVENHIKVVARNGRVAQRELEELAQKAKPVRA